MTIDLSPMRWPLVAGMLLALLLGLGALGAAVTPQPAAPDALLTPQRWQSRRLLRQVQAELQLLQADAARIDALLRAPAPAPVEAMLLAQRIYGHHVRGSSATSGARLALIAAAEATARASVGATGREQALAAAATARELLDALAASQNAQLRRTAHAPRPALYLPFVLDRQSLVVGR